MSPLVAGVDEAGRGPLAGPVVVAAVVLDPDRPRINGLDDSKKLNAARRDALYARITERALAWHVVAIPADRIDQMDILQATLLGMEQVLEAAVAACAPRPCVARIDGNRLPRRLCCPAEALVGGDARDRAIMAASILAKVTRDRTMVELHGRYPQYGFDRHKGYPTPAHLAALQQHGPCPEHRQSFAPVREAMSLLHALPDADPAPGRGAAIA